MTVEIVVFILIVAVVALWALHSIIRSGKDGCCGGSNPDQQAKCGSCPSASKSQHPKQGGD